MKILVTGGTGFLGKYSCFFLLKQGYQVGALGRNAKIGEQLKRAGITFHQLDLSDYQQLEQIVSQYDIVVHCAALSSSWGRYRDFYNSNYLATKNICNACIANNIQRLIHISSPSIYFQLKTRLAIKESDPLPKKMVNHYANSKLLAEQQVDQSHQQGLFTVTLRPQAIFGPEDPAIIPRLIKANKRLGIPIFNQGETKIDITYVANVAEAIRLAIIAPHCCNGKKYNISNNQPINLAPFLKRLFKKMNTPFRQIQIPYPIAINLARLLELSHRLFAPNKEPALSKYSVGVLAFSRTLDISKAQQDLNYHPIVSMEQGVDNFCQWWLNER